MNACIVIPTFNEAENIGPLLDTITHLYPEYRILVVDDNSPDQTARIVAGRARTNSRISLLVRPRKQGLGQAYIDGFKYALSDARGYDKIIEMDADFSHSPAQIGRLMQMAEHDDVCIGSRYVKGGSIRRWQPARVMLSFLANVYCGALLGNSVKDWTSGFRCFSRRVLDGIHIDSITARGYLFQIEVLHRCLHSGFTVSEVPVTFVDRMRGRTKLGIRQIGEAAWGVIRLRFS